jgi:hypothetical protein
MDVAQVSDWLKNTILGIVVLGAIGSLVAPQDSGRELERWNPPFALAPSLGRAFR